MKKYENFCKALENLQDIYQYAEPYNNVILAGWWLCMRSALNRRGRL